MEKNETEQPSEKKMTLSDVLKSHRQQKRISLHTVRKETRISINYLEALEAGDWKIFPAEVYLTGFLRRYSEYLGLDPEAMIQLYKNEQDALRSVQLEKSKKEVEVKQKEESLSRVKGLVLFLFIGLLGLWWGMTVMESPTRDKDRPPKPLLAQRAEKAEPARPEILTLNATAADEVWVRVTADDKLLFEGFLSKGASRTWVAENQILIRIGNVDRLGLHLNGVAVDPRPGAQQSINELVLTRQTLEDASRIPEGAPPAEPPAGTPPGAAER